jgi:CRISPR-associated protein Cas6
MLWQEDDNKHGFEVDDSVIDLLFSLECRELPVDHIQPLAAAIHAALDHEPELLDAVSINPVHLAGSQNGWERPDPKLGQNLILSKRTKLVLRVKKQHQQTIIGKLLDATLDIDGFRLTLRKPKVRKLSKESTVFSRAIVCEEGEAEDEMKFLTRMQRELAGKGIVIRKALCGKTSSFMSNDGELFTRSLMLAEIPADLSVKLQQEGLGNHQHLGCGIFIPHKGIAAVGEATDDVSEKIN